jgi:hypothetical protein
MPAKIVVMSEWKAEHPPVLRCWNAAVKCWWNWASLAWYFPIAMSRISHIPSERQ